jgi:hypothetical protein
MNAFTISLDFGNVFLASKFAIPRSSVACSCFVQGYRVP